MNDISLKKNIILNYIRTATNILFPLITYPYAYRILLTEGMGVVKFVTSVMVYMQLIATLGVSNYAIREGTKYREDKFKISGFAKEILYINTISMVISYFLIALIVFIPKVKPYRSGLVLYSLLLVLSVISVEWIYSIYEDFFYITMRALAFQVGSLILLFLLVRNKDDVNMYLLVTVISTAGSAIFNILHSRKYIDWTVRINKKNISNHLKPILIMFGMTLATKIYLNMDVIMISMIKGDHYSGLYGSAIQINTALSVAITAISGVTLPRLSAYLSNNLWSEYNKLVHNCMNYLMFATIPTIAGLFCVSYSFIVLYCGISFVDASTTMKIILPNLFCSIMNGFIAYQIFMPLKKEKWALYGSLIGAAINFTFNSIFIPFWAQNGAAIATVMTELSIFIYFIYKGKSLIDFKSIFAGIWKYFIAAISYPIVYSVIYIMGFKNNLLLILLEIFVGTIFYLALLILLKCSFVLTLLNEVKSIWRKKRIG